MEYLVVEHWKGERCGEAAAFDDFADAEEYIKEQFAIEGLYDYKTTFTIEERE